MNTGGSQQFGDVYKGLAVFSGRGRIHQDDAAVLGLQAKVTAKAGVAGSRLQAVDLQSEAGFQGVQPGDGLLQARVGSGRNRSRHKLREAEDRNGLVFSSAAKRQA